MILSLAHLPTAIISSELFILVISFSITSHLKIKGLKAKVIVIFGWFCVDWFIQEFVVVILFCFCNAGDQTQGLVHAR